MTSLRLYDGAVAIVTGGASGIGRAIGSSLAKRGATVVLADRDEAMCEEAAESIRQNGKHASARTLDVTDPIANQALVDAVHEEHKRIDLYFNNAGIGIGGEASRYSIEDWNRVLDVNIRGVVHGAHAVYPKMIAQGFGHIVNTASVAGLLPSPGAVSYTTSKHAVVGLSKGLRPEAARHGVRVTALCPGVVRTPILTGGKFGGFVQEAPKERVEAFWESLRPIEPGAFAERVVVALKKNPSILIIPGWWRWIELGYRMSPAFSMWFSTWIYRRESPYEP